MRIIHLGQSVIITMALLGILNFGVDSERSGISAPSPSHLSIAHAQTDVPSARYGASMAFDSKRNKIVLFGGCPGDCSGGSNANNETWEFDWTSWTRVTTAHSPTPRLWAGMVYDTQREVTVLFGGYGLNDTWEYDGTDWTQKSPPNRPAPRTAIDLAYDTERQVVVLSSGHQPTYCNSGTYYTDVWEYDGANWTLRISSGGPLNELPSIAYDPIRQQTVHYVGRYNCNLYSQTWAYDGTTVSRLWPTTSPPSTSGPIRFHAVLAKVALVGGCAGSDSSRCTRYSSDIWTFDGTTWSLLDIASKPPGRYFHSVIYDTTRQRLVVFGGCANYYWGLRCTSALNDLWTFDGTRWRQFGSTLDCSESPVFSGIRHCTRGAAHVLKIDPKVVRFETTLAIGYDYKDVRGECRDVSTPYKVPAGGDFDHPGPRCHVAGDDTRYPRELVGEMATRDPGNVAAAAFNTDYFEPSYLWGPQGLTVKNGDRFDGPCYGDFDVPEDNAMTRPSLAISDIGYASIGIASSEAPTDCKNIEPYVTDPHKYWNTVGGGPILVKNGVSVVKDECDTDPDYCPSRTIPRARTAVGISADRDLIVVVVPEPPGIILDDGGNPEVEDLSDLMISLGAVEAMNLDGGGSSQLWYNDKYPVSSYEERRVPEAMLVFSSRICAAEAALSEESSALEYKTVDTEDLLSLYGQLRDDVLSSSNLGQGYIEDYGQYGPEVTEILLTDSGLRSRAAQFLENAAPAFGSLLPGSTAEVELTQALYDEAEGLVHDLAYAGSQELQEVMFQTWEDLALDEHIGETATEIWQQMPHHTVYLPLILR